MSVEQEAKWVRFVSGAFASSTAEFFTLPIDCTKVRLQAQGMPVSSGGGAVQYSGMVDAMSQISRHEGLSALWKGLTPAVLRQASYSSMCMVLYEPIRNAITTTSEDNKISFFDKLMAGGIGGAISISFANPVDIIKVRMQADRTGVLYSGVFDAVKKITAAEGYRGFFKGVWPNIQRGFIVNAAELGTYDHSKQYIINSGLAKEGVVAHVGASFVAGFAGASASNPVDVVKTRLMTQPTHPNGTGTLYRGMMDCSLQIMKKEGVSAFYKGFIPNWMRKAPWCVIFFVSYEQYRNLINKQEECVVY